MSQAKRYWLVVEPPTPLKNMSSSIGMMTFPTEWKNKIHTPNHQADYSTLEKNTHMINLRSYCGCCYEVCWSTNPAQGLPTATPLWLVAFYIVDAIGVDLASPKAAIGTLQIATEGTVPRMH